MNMLDIILKQLPYIIQKVDDTTWQILSRHRKPLYVNEFINTESNDPANTMIFFRKKPSEKQLLKIVENDDSFIEREDGEIVRIILYDPNENFTAIDNYKTEEFAERKGENWVKYLRRMIKLNHLKEHLLYQR